MGIDTALTECLDAVVVPDNHHECNSKDSDNKGGGEESEIPSSKREGRTGARRARGGAVAAVADNDSAIHIPYPSFYTTRRDQDQGVGVGMRTRPRPSLLLRPILKENL